MAAVAPALVTDEEELRKLREDPIEKFSDAERHRMNDNADSGELDVSPPNMEPSKLARKPRAMDDPFPHRHFKTIHPVCNLLLAWKWDQTQKAKLASKIGTMKSGTRIPPPKVYQHLQVKLKKIQMEEDRLKEIQRDNKILLERMAHVIKSENKSLKVNRDREKRYIRSLKVMSSMRGHRLTQKITKENEAMLQRIESRKPQYDHLKWLEDRYTQIRYLQNISAFPKKYIDLKHKMDRVLGLAEGKGQESEQKTPAPASPKKLISTPPKEAAPVKPSPRKQAAKVPAPVAATDAEIKPKKKAPLPAIKDSSNDAAAQGTSSKAPPKANKKLQRESSPIETTKKKTVKQVPAQSESSEAAKVLSNHSIAPAPAAKVLSNPSIPPAAKVLSNPSIPPAAKVASSHSVHSASGAKAASSHSIAPAKAASSHSISSAPAAKAQSHHSLSSAPAAKALSKNSITSASAAKSGSKHSISSVAKETAEPATESAAPEAIVIATDGDNAITQADAEIAVAAVELAEAVAEATAAVVEASETTEKKEENANEAGYESDFH